MINIHQLFIYPVKSMKGISLEKSLVLPSGLEFDRYFMITQPNGDFITARENPKLLKLSVLLFDHGIHIAVNKDIGINVNLSDFSSNQERTTVWGTKFTSKIASIAVNRFLSDYLQKDVQLRWISEDFSRSVNRYPNTPLGFADAYPFLLINRSSFEYLQQQCPEKIDIKQFRANIIIENALPFAEDSWKTIKIGDIIFDLVKPCSRCVMTTVKPDSDQYLPNNEPLTTLSYFRKDENGEIDFGMNMIARNSGELKLNDHVEILERHSAKNYIKSYPRPNTIPTEQCEIQIENQKTIKGNNKQPLIEQLEQQGIGIPYSCRTGICGKCTIELIEGDVQGVTTSAIRRNHKILACSCIPKGNIKIRIP